MNSSKRRFLAVLGIGGMVVLGFLKLPGLFKNMKNDKKKYLLKNEPANNISMEKPLQNKNKKILTNAQWKEVLGEKEYQVLRKHGTEPAFSSLLNDEKREGVYYCKGCNVPLFTSAWKFDSGTGWPSFYTSIKGSFVTSTDYKLLYPRTEYSCATCEGHHGHIFKDGPNPTKQRWCNNGVVLTFKPQLLNGQFESEAGLEA